MKKTIFLLIILSCFVFCGACDFLPVGDSVQNRVKKNMYDYYSDDANYYWCVGVVKEVQDDLLFIHFGTTINELKWTGYFWDYSTEGDVLSSYFETGDVVEFCMSHPFDKNMEYPLVSIKKEDRILLEFEEGKRNLLFWVENLYQHDKV